MGIAQASLVGHSLGAAVGVTYALTHPARVERVALVAGLVPGVHIPALLAPPADPAAGVGEALSLCGRAADHQGGAGPVLPQAPASDVDFLVDHDYAVRATPAARAAWLAAARHMRTDFVTRRGDYRRAIGTLDLPVLLVHGRQDPAVPADHASEVASGLPRVTVRWVDACGHFPHLEHARTVNGWLEEFLVGRTAAR